MSPESTQPVLAVTDLVKKFRRADGTVVNAVDHIDLTVERSEFVVLLGPSGCGKTTLLRCVAGLEQPDSGRIDIHGRTQYSSLPPKVLVPPEGRNLSMVFQTYALWPHMTVFDNVAYPLARRHLSRAAVREAVTASLERVGVGQLGRQHPAQLSGGQQQRVALARALVANEDVILFDEPLSNVDARVRERLRYELLSLQQEIGFAALYVTHDQSEAMAMASRVAVLAEGKVGQIGPPEEIYLRPTSRNVAKFIGSSNEIHGVVAGLDTGDGIEIDTPIGPVRAGTATRDLAVGDQVAVMWRPERGNLVNDDPQAGNRWPVTIDANMFVGSHAEIYVRVGETTPIQVWALEPLADSVEKCWLHIDPKWVTALPADD